MKKIILFIILVGAEFLLSHAASAQGTIFISNLGQTTTGSAQWQVTLGLLSHLPQEPIPQVMLGLSPIVNGCGIWTASGFTASIYSSPGNGAPGSNLGGLVGSDSRCRRSFLL